MTWSSGPGERGRLPDAPAALEELERVHGEQEPALAAVPLDERVDLFVGRAALEPPLDRQGEHRDRRRGRLGVDRTHDAVPELGRGPFRTCEGAGDPRGHVQREDPFERAEILVAGEEVAGRRLRRRGKDRRVAEACVELRRIDVDAVAEAVGAEVDVERHHAPVREALRGVGQVGGRVEDDRRVLGRELHAAVAA